MKHRLAVYAFALLAVGARPVLAHEYYGKGFKVIHPWAEQTTPEATSAPAYMHFEEIAEGDRLVGASTDLADRVVFVDGPDGAAVDSVAIPVPPSESDIVVLGPRGPHLVLIGLRRQLLWGRAFPLRLVFERSGVIDTELSIGQH